MAGTTNAVPVAKPGVAAVATPTSTNNAWLEQFVRKTPPTPQTPTAPVASSPPVVAEATATHSEVITNTASVDPVPPLRRSRRQSRKDPTPPAAVEAAKAEAVASTVPSTPAAPEMAPGRWVRREGILVWPKNIVAPSHLALKAREGGRIINFVILTQPGVPSLREYRGRVVILTGREYLDKRPVWRNIPLLDVESIEAVR